MNFGLKILHFSRLEVGRAGFSEKIGQLSGAYCHRAGQRQLAVCQDADRRVVGADVQQRRHFGMRVRRQRPNGVHHANLAERDVLHDESGAFGRVLEVLHQTTFGSTHQDFGFAPVSGCRRRRLGCRRFEVAIEDEIRQVLLQVGLRAEFEHLAKIRNVGTRQVGVTQQRISRADRENDMLRRRAESVDHSLEVIGEELTGRNFLVDRRLDQDVFHEAEP